MKKLTRVLALLLCASMLVSLAACRKNKQKKPNKTNSQTTNQEDTFSSELSYGDDFDIGDLEDSDAFDIIFSRPVTEGYISSGVKVSLDDETEDDLGADFEDDDFDLDDITEEVYDYQPLIQKFGNSVKGTDRKIHINNSKSGVLYTGFTGISCNVFPTQSSYFAQTANDGKDAEAFMEINGKRFNDTSPHYARAWFQIDWMITQESGNHKSHNPTENLEWEEYKENGNWEENPDYINYYNRVYCFSDGEKMNDEFNAFIDYCEMLDEANVEIYLAFGWKIADRIADWFGADPIQKNTSAPLDLDAYADAAVALFKYMRNEVGLDNFNVLSFYNEPNRTNDYGYYKESDFATIGDKGVYWAQMAKKCRKALDAEKGLKDVKIMGADLSGSIDVSSENFVNPYLRNNEHGLVDAYTVHYYDYYNHNYTYEDLFDQLVFVSNFYADTPVMITETWASEIDVTSGDYKWVDWGCSLGSLFTASANNGILGVFRWAYVGGVIYNPIAYDPQNNSKSSWIRPVDVKSINDVRHAYYEDAIINQYVPDNANIHYIEWDGEDLRASAFTSKDSKDFALVVEANEHTTARNIKASLESSLNGKNIYVYAYNHSIVPDGNATIPQAVDVISSVSRSFKYTINKQYGLYVFSTIKPVKQVEVFAHGTSTPAAAITCKINQSVTIDAKLLDCDTDDTLKWEIKRYSGAVKTKKKVEQPRENCIETGTYTEKGSITNVSADTLSMTYTATNEAEKGDVIAIRCTIVDGDTNVKNDRYAVATIIID